MITIKIDGKTETLSEVHCVLVWTLWRLNQLKEAGMVNGGRYDAGNNMEIVLLKLMAMEWRPTRSQVEDVMGPLQQREPVDPRIVDLIMYVPNEIQEVQ
jgi:hypothetical protein